MDLAFAFVLVFAPLLAPLFAPLFAPFSEGFSEGLSEGLSGPLSATEDDGAKHPLMLSEFCRVRSCRREREGRAGQRGGTFGESRSVNGGSDKCQRWAVESAPNIMRGARKDEDAAHRFKDPGPWCSI